MQVLTIKVDAISAQEEVRADFSLEKKKGETWNRMKVVTVTSGGPDAERKFVLQDDERLVIEGQMSKVVVYDREQGMAKVVAADPEQRAKDEAAEAALKSENTAAQEKHNEDQKQKAEQAAAAIPRTNLGNPVPPTPQGAPRTEPPKVEMKGGAGTPPPQQAPQAQKEVKK